MRVWRARIIRHRTDIAIGFALLVLALALRIPYLYLVPVWSDEVSESAFALQISQGLLNPLQDMAQYTGSLHPDLVALVLKFVQDPRVPRAVNLVLAALTIPLTFLLGSALHQRAVGVLAALFLATSSTHIVINSHYAYSSASTPFFSTCACLWLVLAEKRNNAWWLGLAGVSAALAIQTHPVALAVVPGLLVWFFAFRKQWHWFQRPGLYFAGLATVVTYTPVLYAIARNLTTFQQSIASRSYAIETNHTLGAYAGNVQNLIVELVRMVGAQYGSAGRPLLYLTDPLTLAFAILVPLGVFVSWRAAQTLSLFALASAALIIPYFNYQYDAFPSFTRYVAFMLPLVYIVIAAFITKLWNWMAIQTYFNSRLARAFGKILIAVFVLALLVFPALRTFQYFDGRMQAGASNAPFLEIAQRIDSEKDTRLLIDDSLRAGEFPSGGNLYRAFRVWFRFRSRPYVLTSSGVASSAPVCPSSKSFLIATVGAADALTNACQILPLLTYQIPTRPGRAPLAYGLYEIAPLQ